MDTIKKNWVKSERSEVLYIGKNTFYYPIIERDSNVDDFILTVSHLYPYKNIEILLDAYSSMNLDKEGIYLLISYINNSN